jgi:hypothetical protein
MGGDFDYERDFKSPAIGVPQFATTRFHLSLQ